MIEGKSFYFHGTVVAIRTQEQRMKNQSNYNRQSEQKEICETKLIIIQSKLQAREDASHQVVTGFRFESDWLKDGARSFWTNYTAK